MVATGAEDSTVRLWDLRDGGATGSGSSSRVAHCLCRCFDGEAVASVVFGAGGANRLYCSAGGKVSARFIFCRPAKLNYGRVLVFYVLPMARSLRAADCSAAVC